MTINKTWLAAGAIALTAAMGANPASATVDVHYAYHPDCGDYSDDTGTISNYCRVNIDVYYISGQRVLMHTLLPGSSVHIGWDVPYCPQYQTDQVYEVYGVNCDQILECLYFETNCPTDGSAPTTRDALTTPSAPTTQARNESPDEPPNPKDCTSSLKMASDNPDFYVRNDCPSPIDVYYLLHYPDQAINCSGILVYPGGILPGDTEFVDVSITLLPRYGRTIYWCAQYKIDADVDFTYYSVVELLEANEKYGRRCHEILSKKQATICN